MKTKLLIAGGSGFIGSNLIKFYSQKEEYEVFSTTRVKKPQVKPENVTFYNVNLTRREDVQDLFKETRPEIVIIASAVTTGSKDVIERPHLHYTDNIIMNALVLEACNEFKVKHTLFFSCSTMMLSKDTPQKESDWNISDEIYPAYFPVANMKIAVEKLCESYARLGRGKYTVIRNSNIFGQFDKFDFERCHLMPATIRKVYEATDTIEIWGDEVNQAHRDLVYVDDLVDLVDRALKFQKTPYELYNCGAGKAYSVTEIVKTVQKVLNKENLKLTYNTSKPNIPITIILNTDKAYQELGWQPKVTLEEGIARTIEWYRKL